jgi:dihydrolipoamide dehydrogenase
VSAGSSFDLFVIGGGPAGYTAALLAAKKGLKVGIAEGRGWGGTCTNRGCIPAKGYIEAVKVLGLMERASRFGIEGVAGVKADLDAIRKRTQRVVTRLSKGVELLLARAGVALHALDARLCGRGSIEVGGRRHPAGAVLVATGSRPRREASLDLPGFITSDEVFWLGKTPSSLVILGAGAVGMEMAHVFSHLGSEVTVVEALDRVLPGEDEEVSMAIASHYRRVRFITGARLLHAGSGPRGVSLEMETASGITSTEAELCLLCTGREPVLPEGVVKAGIELNERGGISVDPCMCTAARGVYAAGDVTGSHMYAYVAAREAEVAVAHLTGGKALAMDYANIPGVVFTDPEVASVGRAVPVRQDSGIMKGTFPVSALGRARTMDESEGFATVTCTPDGVIRRVSILAPHATELISWASLAVHAGLTLEEFLGPLYPHPTMAELLKEAAEDALGRCINKP